MPKIEGGNPAEKTLWVQAAPSQSEDIIDIQDSLGNSHARMDNDGNLIFNTELSFTHANEPKRKYRYCGVEGAVTFTDNGGGNITVNAGYVYLTDDVDGKNAIYRYHITNTSLDLADGVTNYVVAEYNGGTPQYDVIVDRDAINFLSIVPVVTIYRQGAILHPLTWSNTALGMAEKNFDRVLRVRRFERETGLGLSEAATRRVLIGSGAVWYGIQRVVLDAFTSVSDPCYIWYHSGGAWTHELVTQYDNFYYDNGTDRVEAGTNKFLVNWIYRAVEDSAEAHIVLGTAFYTSLTLAQQATVPTPPGIISAHCVLVGRIIVVKNADTASAVESAFAQSFVVSTVQSHNDLSNIQGGADAQYYHLTSAEHGAIITSIPPVGKSKITNIYWDPDISEIVVEHE